MQTKTILQQKDTLRDLTLLLLTGACIALGGCETANMRTELAPPPPAFVPEIQTAEIHTVIQQQDLSKIEPAAGNTAAVIKTSAAPVSCLQVGLKEEDELYYQWGGKRLGLDISSRDGGDRYQDNSQATFRYSFSLQKKAPDRACRDDVASEKFRNIFNSP
jgi:hypothetical protein